MDQIVGYGGQLATGTLVTIELALASLVIALVLGLLGAWAKLSRSRLAQRLAGAYTTIVRGVPDLVLILLVFFGGQVTINSIGASTGLWGYVDISKFVAGTATIGVIYGAYFTETFRGAILAIPRGQIEAGISCGMSKSLIFRHVIWPQMVRYALPGFTNNWLVLIKATALISLIGLQEMTYLAKQASAATRSPFAFFLFTGALFLFYTWVLLSVLRRLHARYSLGTKRGDL